MKKEEIKKGLLSYLDSIKWGIGKYDEVFGSLIIMLSFPEKDVWIPVSERLPDDGEWALFTDGKAISVERFKLDAENHFFPSGRWFEFDKAIAWMPLPEPYKAESEE